MVRRIGIIVGLMCAGLFAQRSDTIWQNLGSSATGSFTSSPVNNIGQSSHLLYVSAAGANCTTLTGGLQFSWDGTNYVPFGSQYLGITGSSAPLYPLLATGAYPYVRALLSVNTACTLTVYYTGAITSPYTLTQGAYATDLQVDLQLPSRGPAGIVTGAIGARRTGGTTGIAIPNVEGIDVRPVSDPVGTLVQLNDIANAISNRIYVSQLVVSADTNATVLTLLEGSGGLCGTGPITLGTWKLNAGIPLNLGKFRTVVLGDDLCISTTVGTVTGMITFGQMGSVVNGY